MLNKFLSVAVAMSVSSLLTSNGSAQMQGGVQGVQLRYQNEGLSFSILLPEDWDAQMDSNGFEVFAEPKEKVQPTESNPVVADPNLTVTASRNPMPVDEEALEPYAAQMQVGLIKTLGENSGLEIFLKKAVDLPEDRTGLLYYLRYKKGSFDVYNAVLVVSTDTHLFRVTLTDYEVGFDANLERLFPFMASIDVGPGKMMRESLVIVLAPWLAAGLALLMLLGGFHALRSRLSQSKLTESLEESMHEQTSSQAPHKEPLFFKSGGNEQEYDPEFNETYNQSRYGGHENEFSEVPLSEAIGSRSQTAGPGRGPGRGSVTDPETEVSGISGHYNGGVDSRAGQLDDAFDVPSSSLQSSSVEGYPDPRPTSVVKTPRPPRFEAAPERDSADRKAHHPPRVPPAAPPAPPSARPAPPAARPAPPAARPVPPAASTAPQSSVASVPAPSQVPGSSQSAAPKSSAFGMDFSRVGDADESDDV
jgi:hypothetical protein